MAGESKGDNKLFQLVMVLVTTIVAPVSVYFITHSIRTPAETPAAPTSTLSAQVDGVAITATPDLPLVSPTAALPPTMTAQSPTTPAQPIAATVESDPGGIQNPRGTLPADAVGIVNGMAVSVVSEKVQLKDGTVSIQIRLRNQSGAAQTLRYQVQSITVLDAKGRKLEVLLDEKHSDCSKKDLSAERKIELAPDQEIILQSVEANKSWCASDDARMLPLFKAPDREASKALVIQFDGFGPFRGFGFQIDF